jgi:hypothetical protein
VRDGAEVAELTGLLHLGGWPAGTRVIVRRERPHPGAQLSLFEEADGWGYTAFVTNTTTGQLQWLEARHRAHARVEDRIRCAKDTGWAGYPPDGELATAEPKRLRYRILHAAARLVRGQRRRRLGRPTTMPGTRSHRTTAITTAGPERPASGTNDRGQSG